MSTKKRSKRRFISQTEAHRLLARVRKLERVLEDQRNGYIKDWPEGTYLGVEVKPGETLDAAEVAVLRTARRLQHAVVVTLHNEAVQFHAIRLMSKAEQP